MCFACVQGTFMARTLHTCVYRRSKDVSIKQFSTVLRTFYKRLPIVQLCKCQLDWDFYEREPLKTGCDTASNEVDVHRRHTHSDFEWKVCARTRQRKVSVNVDVDLGDEHNIECHWRWSRARPHACVEQVKCSEPPMKEENLRQDDDWVALIASSAPGCQAV